MGLKAPVTGSLFPAVRERGRPEFVYNGHRIAFDDDRFVNLTDMWRAAGSPENKDPAQWRRYDGKEFIEYMGGVSNMGKSHVWKTKRGQHSGGTWAHWQIALAYAKYLSHEFHRLANEAFREWVEEKSDPGLKIERGINDFRKQGKSEVWIEDRVMGIATRHVLTSRMSDHNCRQVGNNNPYAEATRSITLQVLGRTPREIREEKGLPKSAKTRDHLDSHELVRLRFAESEAALRIKEKAADGNEECVECCREAGKAVRVALDSLGQK